MGHPAGGGALVVGGALDGVDYQDFYGIFGWLELQAELVLERGEEEVSGFDGAAVRPGHLAVVGAFEAGLVEDGTVVEFGLMADPGDEKPEGPALGAEMEGGLNCGWGVVG